jgi:hypothetical protein
MKITHSATKILIAALAGVGLLLSACSSPEVGPTTDPSSTGAENATATVQGCMDAKEVWLVVSDQAGKVYANECVGTPDTAVAALEAANQKLTYDSSGLICAIGDVPAECPATFDGNFWGFYQATVGSAWEFAQSGPADTKPDPASIVGFCYGETCTPPDLDGAIKPAA